MDRTSGNSVESPDDIPLSRRIFGIGFTDVATFEERRTYLRMAIQIAFPVTLIFSLLNYLNGHTALALIEFFDAIIMLSASFQLLKNEVRIGLAENVAIGYGLIITAALATLGGIDNSGPLWVIAFPFFAFFIKRQRGGWSSCFAWWVTLGVSFALLADQSWAWNYSADYNAQIAYMLVFYTLIAAAFNLVRTDFEIKLKGHNLQLQRARSTALKASQAKAEFLARMSHEIRNPLNAVIGFSQVLKDNPNAPDQSELLDTVNLSSRLLLTLVDDILSFSKLDSEALELENIEFDLHSVLEGVVSMLSPKAHKKSLEFALLLHTDLPVWITGDPNRLTQVVANIVSNALKFTDKGQVFIEAELIESDTNFHIQIRVNDTGIGLDKDEIERLFHPFVQADSSISRRFGGTGLGLYISKRLMDLMQGDIQVESTKNRGSRFTITLPIARTSISSTNDLVGLEGRSIVIYDPKPITRRCLRTTTSIWGMEVTNLSNLDLVYALLAPLDKPLPDLLLLSLDTSERETVRFETIYSQIRCNYSGPILLMLDADYWDAPEFINGANNLYWISKPARRTTLFQKISTILSISPQDIVVERIRQETIDIAPAASLKSLLIVDDQPLNRQLIRRYLQGLNLNIHEASSGREAIQIASDNVVDMIFMDIHMPDMSGIEAAKKIRMLCSNKPPYIVSLTADVYVDKQINDNSDQIVFDEFLLKPVMRDTIRQAVVDLLGPDLQLHPEAPDMRAPDSTSVFDERILTELITLSNEAETSLASADWAAVKSVVHKLKGISGLYQIHSLSEQVDSLAQLVAEKDSIGCQQLLNEIVKQLAM